MNNLALKEPENALALNIRKKIVNLELAMSDLPQLEITPVHRFAKGVYAREINIPAGTLLVGKIHRTEHILILSKGRVTIVTEDGEQMISAPHTLISRPGIKRAVYAHEDSVWTGIHGTEETDLLKIEQELIAPNFAALEGVK